MNNFLEIQTFSEKQEQKIIIGTFSKLWTVFQKHKCWVFFLRCLEHKFWVTFWTYNFFTNANKIMETNKFWISQRFFENMNVSEFAKKTLKHEHFLNVENKFRNREQIPKREQFFKHEHFLNVENKFQNGEQIPKCEQFFKHEHFLNVENKFWNGEQIPKREQFFKHEHFFESWEQILKRRTNSKARTIF